MPDFERVLDDLRMHLAETPEDKAWVKGFMAGKKHARKEILYVSLCIAVIAVIIVAHTTF